MLSWYEVSGKDNLRTLEIATLRSDLTKHNYFIIQLKCNWFLWIFPGILFIAGAVVYGVMVANGLANAYGSGEDVSIKFVFIFQIFDELTLNKITTPKKSAMLNAIENGMDKECVKKFVTIITISITTSI